MTRAEALRKLLAIGSLYRDEIFTTMGGDPFDVSDARARSGGSCRSKHRGASWH